MFLFDLGLTIKDEPFKKMINQGMIQGRSSLVYRVNTEKMAEYYLWEKLRNKGMGVAFERDFRDGHRKFDFFSPEAKLIIEVRRVRSLEKVVHPYADYASEKGYKILLIPTRDMLFEKETVFNKIAAAILGEEVPEFEEKPELQAIPVFASKNIEGREQFTEPIHVDISLVHNDILDIEAFKKWQPHLAEAVFLLEDDKYYCGWEVEKMSKSKYNVQNPDELIDRYGADTLRMYEMFLGPLEQSKPWDTQGIEGVFRFIRKFWRLFHNENLQFSVSDQNPEKAELKILHKTIRKVEEDIERFSFNTAVSAFMICTNELADLKSNKRDILEPLVILISPYAPHLAEELWHLLGHNSSVTTQPFPQWNDQYLIENTFAYPVSFNGKKRFELELPLDMDPKAIEARVLANEDAAKWIAGKPIKKIIIVPNRIINIVV
jgi:leucyl-tRNA synthetase